VRTREEHLAWSKQRALEYVDAGKPIDGIGSMMCYLKKHPELENHPAIQLGAMLMLGGHLSHPVEARRFIEGFN
jgi:hypothetical protein